MQQKSLKAAQAFQCWLLLWLVAQCTHYVFISYEYLEHTYTQNIVPAKRILCLCSHAMFLPFSFRELRLQITISIHLQSKQYFPYLSSIIFYILYIYSTIFICVFDVSIVFICILVWSGVLCTSQNVGESFTRQIVYCHVKL